MIEVINELELQADQLAEVSESSRKLFASNNEDRYLQGKMFTYDLCIDHLRRVASSYRGLISENDK